MNDQEVVHAVVVNDQKIVRTTVTFDINVPKEDWIDFLIDNTDIFSTNYIGYWAYGVAVDGGWLVYEHDDARPSDRQVKTAERKHKHGVALPEKWYLLDEKMAIKAYVEACKLWGIDWMNGDHGDSAGYDVAMQLAMLGEIRYG